MHCLDELHARHLQQLDRLLQLGRHDQLLRHLELLFELQNPYLSFGVGGTARGPTLPGLRSIRWLLPQGSPWKTAGNAAECSAIVTGRALYRR